jgi:hypothetical protein
MAIPPDPLNRKPWPMKWIVVAIIACIIPYTWLTLAYRKENPAHQPYQDNKDRAQVLRLLDSGFHRYAVTLETLTDPAAPPSSPAEITRIDGGLPPLLRDVLIDSPPLPDRLPVVAAPAQGLAAAPYAFTFACTQPGPDERPATATLYQRGTELVFVVAYENLPGDLQARRLDATGRITVPARTLDPGTYQVTLLGTQESRRWTLELH